MADSYVDYALGTGANDGSDWTNAYHTTTPTQNALTDAGVGGRVFIKTDSSGTNTDIIAAAQTLTSPGTILNPTNIYGCKSGTSATPPTNSDLNTRGATDIPSYGTSGDNADLLLAGFCQVVGMNFQTSDELRVLGSTDTSWVFEDCDILVATTDDNSIGIFIGTNAASLMLRLIDCDLDMTRASARIRMDERGTFLWKGGTLLYSTSAPTAGFILALMGNHLIEDVDLSSVGANALVGVGTMENGITIFKNCKVHASYSLITGTFVQRDLKIEIYSSSADTAISTSVPGYESETAAGNVITETSRVRTGGADDGAAGLFSWAMLPNANAVLFPNDTLQSPPMGIWLDGTETTITVNIANDSASTDMQDDEVWLEVIASNNILDTAQYVINRDRMAILGTAVDQDDDTGSTWGSGANNHQKLVVTVAPGYQGLALCYVHCAERAASPKTVYVDPRPELA